MSPYLERTGLPQQATRYKFVRLDRKIVYGSVEIQHIDIAIENGLVTKPNTPVNDSGIVTLSDTGYILTGFGSSVVTKEGSLIESRNETATIFVSITGKETIIDDE